MTMSILSRAYRRSTFSRRRVSPKMATAYSKRGRDLHSRRKRAPGHVHWMAFQSTVEFDNSGARFSLPRLKFNLDRKLNFW